MFITYFITRNYRDDLLLYIYNIPRLIGGLLKLLVFPLDWNPETRAQHALYVRYVNHLAKKYFL